MTDAQGPRDADRLRMFIERAGASPAELARYSGVEEHLLHQYLAGSLPVPLHLVRCVEISRRLSDAGGPSVPAPANLLARIEALQQTAKRRSHARPA